MTLTGLMALAAVLLLWFAVALDMVDEPPKGT